MTDDLDREIEEVGSGLQDESRNYDHLKPWQYKPGQSGNPSGKKPGTVSMKTYVKNKLLSMTDDEREEFLEGVDKKVIWEMAEDKAGQGVNVTGEITSKIVRLDVE